MAAELIDSCLKSPEDSKPMLQRWQVQDLERGHRNLCHLATSVGVEGLQALVPVLARVLPTCADPDMALNNLERLLAKPAGRAHLAGLLEPRSRTLETLLQLLGASQFLSDTLIGYPDELEMIRVPLRSSPNRTELLAQLQGAVDQAQDDATVLGAFRQFRRRQLLRIGANDMIRARSLEEITADISRLADVSLEVALHRARQHLAERFGEPHTSSGEPARQVILAFGKLGGKELNYSSDIDLMMVYDEEGPTRGKRISSIGNDEFFGRVIGEVVRLLSAHTDAGQAYRIDLRLRPEGQRGPLARSMDSTLAYYDRLGRTWERQALIKLRPVAGDLRLGESFVKAIEPFVYRKYLSFAEINEIKALKRRIEQKTQREGSSEQDVKTGHGGIRDVEFTIQFLQLLNGGDLPEVRQRNTLRALYALEAVGCLTDQEYHLLDDAYRFLRKVEHRLQLMFDLQTHRWTDSDQLRRLAVSTALAAGEGQGVDRDTLVERFLETYRVKTDLNRKILDHILHDAFVTGDGDEEPEADLILAPDPDPETIARVLGKYRFHDAQKAYLSLTELARESVPFLSTRRCRHFLASIAANLLRALSEAPDPDMALINLEKVSASLGSKGVLWELFSFSPAALKLYVDLCAWSQFLSDILISNPGMIDDLLDSLILNQPRTRAELHQELTELCRKADDPELIIHSFQDKELLRIGVRDILSKDTVQETTAALSDLAEVILEQITDLQLPALERRYGVPYLTEGPRAGQSARFVLLGLGKLGGREMSYQSDLDLILIYEGDGRTGPPPGASRFDSFESTDHFHYFTELAQRLIRAISFMGPRGRLYHVDMRLRPTGKSGSLVMPLTEFDKYYASSAAQLWERQALTRARLVYGDADFGAQVIQAVMRAAYGLEWKPRMAEDIAAMRERIQASGRGRDLKRGYGGLIDIEFLVQLYRLRYGAAIAELRCTNTWDALRTLHEAHRLSETDFATLWDSLQFLRIVESRLRIVHNRSLDELPDKPQDLDRLARRLGFEAERDNAAGQRFLEKLDQHLAATRAVFARLVEKEKES